MAWEWVPENFPNLMNSSHPDEDDELSLLLLELESSVVLACKDKLALTKYVFTQSIQQMKHCYN